MTQQTGSFDTLRARRIILEGNPEDSALVDSAGTSLKGTDVDIPAGPLLVVKSADEIINNSTTLQDDDELVLALEANTSYIFEAHLFHIFSTASDLKAAFTVPAGSTLNWSWAYSRGTDGLWQGGTSTRVQTVSGTASTLLDGAGVLSWCRLLGSVITDSTAGNLQLQWAQNSALGANDTMKAGSYLKAIKAS